MNAHVFFVFSLLTYPVLIVIITIRSGMVLKFRLRLIEAIYDSSDWRRLTPIHRSISFDKQYLMFWKPLPDFYAYTPLWDIARNI